MSSYINVIKQAVITFPIIALVITIPFVLIQYHKYGSISFIKSLVIYSFVLYFMCAYFLIILPLPTQEFVASLTTPRVQLIPFSFVIDFFRETSFNIAVPSTYLKALKESCFFVPIYNLLLTMPFGIYLRYYFKTNLKKTIFYTFLLSLFFELTQLTGLYFIYPRGYRLFDIDDLMLNTLGGFLGYLLAPAIIKHLPKRDMINAKAIIKGRRITGFKRFTSACLDLFLFMIFSMILDLFLQNKLSFVNIGYLSIFLYYVLISFILKGSTLGEHYLNMRVVDDRNSNNFLKLLIRKILFITFYIIIPILCLKLLVFVSKQDIQQELKYIIGISVAAIVFLIYAISIIKYTFTNKQMLYEKISHTKMISTIVERDDKEYIKKKDNKKTRTT